MPKDEFWKDPEEIPDDFKICHSELIMYCAHFEIGLIDLIKWALEIRNNEVSREVSGRLSANQRLEMASSIINQMECTEISKLFEIIKRDYLEVAKFRNDIVHGWWLEFGGSAVALTPKPRKSGEPGAALEGRPFSLEDARAKKAQAKDCRDRLYSIINGAPPGITPSRPD